MNKKITSFIRIFCVLVSFVFAPINTFAADIVFTSGSSIAGAGAMLQFNGYPGTYPQNTSDYTVSVTSTNVAITSITVQNPTPGYLYCAMNAAPIGSDVTTIILTYTNGDCGKVTFTGSTFTSTSTCSTTPVSPSLTIDSYTSVIGTATLNMTVGGVPAPTISSVTLDGNTLSSSSYTYTTGKLVINDAALTVGNHTVVVSVSNSEGSASATKAITTTVAPACDPDLSLTSGGKTIIFSSIIRNGDYYIKITGQDFVGIGGSYINVNGTVGKALNTYTIVINPAKTEMLIGPIISTTDPKFYTPLYVNMPGEIVFSTVNGIDLNWCQEDPDPPIWNADPTMTCGGTDAFGLQVSTTDNGTGVAGYVVSLNSIPVCELTIPLTSVVTNHDGVISVPLASCGIVLTSGSNYTATIKAYDALNNFSTTKTVTGIKLQSSPISMGTASCGTAGGTTITLNVSSSGAGVSGYQVSYNSTTVNLEGINEITVTGLTPETTYQFTIKAMDACGNTSSNSVSAICSTVQQPHGGADIPTILTDVPFEMTSTGTCTTSLSGGTTFSTFTQTDEYNHTLSEIAVAGSFNMNESFAEAYSNGYFHETITQNEYAIVSNPKVLNGTYTRKTDGKNRLVFALKEDPNGALSTIFNYKRTNLDVGSTKIAFTIEDLVSTCAQPSFGEKRQFQFLIYVNGASPITEYIEVPVGGSYSYSYTVAVPAGAQVSYTLNARFAANCSAYAISDFNFYSCLQKGIETTTGVSVFCEDSPVTLKAVGFVETQYEWEKSSDNTNWTSFPGSTVSVETTASLGNTWYRVRNVGDVSWSNTFILLGQVCCTKLDEQDDVWIETFGTGTGRWTNPNVNNHTFQPTPNKIDDGFYAVVSNSSDANQSLDWPGNKTDHTGDVNGGFLVINVNKTLTPPVLIYEQTITPAGGFCQSTYYNLSLYASNISPGGLPSSFKFEIVDAATSNILGQGQTGDINDFAMAHWLNFGTSFAPENATSVIIRIYNTGLAGGGNDVVLDDIAVSVCNAEAYLYADAPNIDANPACGSTVSLTTELRGNAFTFFGTSTPYYLWQKSTNGGVTWTIVNGASGISSDSYNAQTVDGETALYRVIVAKDQIEAEKVVNHNTETCTVYTITNVSTVTCVPCTRPKIPNIVNQSVCLNSGNLSYQATQNDCPTCALLWYDASTGGTGTTTTPTQSTTTAGTYTKYVAQKTSGSDCCEGDRIAVEIVVSALPDAPSIEDQSVCQNSGNVSYKATASSGYELQWYDASTGGTPSTTTPTQSTTTSDTYTKYVSQKQIASPNCESARVPVTITVDDIPVISVSASAAPCEGGDITFTATSLAGATYTWTGNASSATNVATVNNVTSGTTYSGTVKATVGGCESAEVPYTQTAKTSPVITVSASAAPCEGGDITFTATSLAGATYTWTGDASSSTNVATVNNVTSGTTYSGTVKATVGGCESAEVAYTQTVKTTPVITVSASAAPCEGGDI
ncbi:MAG: fibronectin type III domain-containing protein, partial [Bacteroidia bacterium]|nr:fibronectin type III domain-containing protein [Bacteroidia bacterium]